MRFNKRASLSLSIEAIVVLVLAISMLGLGLGFTKSMFAKFGTKLDVPAPNIPATEDDPITVESENLQAKVGKPFSFGFNVYNKGTTAVTLTTNTLKVTCTGTGTVPTLMVAQGTINAQTYAPFKALVSSTTVKTGMYLCTITVTYTPSGGTAVTYTKQVTIQYT